MLFYIHYSVFWVQHTFSDMMGYNLALHSNNLLAQSTHLNIFITRIPVCQFSFWRPNSPLSWVTSGLFSPWQLSPRNGNGWHKGLETSQGQPTSPVLHHHQLAVAAHSHCRLQQQHRDFRSQKTIVQRHMGEISIQIWKCESCRENANMFKIPSSSWKFTATVSIQALSVFLGSST